MDGRTIYWIAGTTAAAGIIGLASGYWLGSDNPIEQLAEKYIQSQTGKSVDLSP